MSVFADRGNSVDGHLLLFLGDVPCFRLLRCVREEEEAKDRDWESDDPVCNDALLVSSSYHIRSK